MNSGCFKKEFKDILISIQLVDFNGVVRSIPTNKIKFNYRSIELPKNLIFLSATFKGKQKNSKEINSYMNEINKISAKGQELIEMYKIMANSGNEFTNYKFKDGENITNGYDKFNAGYYKNFLLSQFSDYNIKTLLDYGCGGSD